MKQNEVLLCFHYKFTPIISIHKKLISVIENNVRLIFLESRELQVTKLSFAQEWNDADNLLMMFESFTPNKISCPSWPSIIHLKNWRHLSNILTFWLWLMLKVGWKITRLWLFCILTIFLWLGDCVFEMNEYIGSWCFGGQGMQKMFLRFEEGVLLSGPPPKHISPGRERKEIKGKKKSRKSEWSTSNVSGCP